MSCFLYLFKKNFFVCFKKEGNIMEDKNELTMNNFIKAVNGKMDSDEDFKNVLNQTVINALPEADDTYFGSLEEFANFLPKTIQDHLNKKEIKGKLGKDWENFEIQGQDLEELYNINLNVDTKGMILATFDCDTAKLDKLSEEKDITLAFKTFKKILGNDKVSVAVFHNFIFHNFMARSLSSENMNNIINYVELQN